MLLLVLGKVPSIVIEPPPVGVSVGIVVVIVVVIVVIVVVVEVVVDIDVVRNDCDRVERYEREGEEADDRHCAALVHVAAELGDGRGE